MGYSEAYINEFLSPAMIADFHGHCYEMTMMNKAHGLMLVKQGLLDKSTYLVIADGLDRVFETLKEEDLDKSAEDLYSNLQTALYRQVGAEVGCQIHLGRSRNDMGRTVFRMEIRKTLWRVMECLLSLQRTLLQKAGDNLETVITYYTYGQPAQPGTLAHYYMMLFDVLTRDFTRLQAAYRTNNRCPMGAAAGIGTSFPLNRQLLCDLLGFDSVIENCMDAISSTDYMMETATALSLMMTNISKATADHLFWATDECGILDCGPEISGGSSIMPQKRNAMAIGRACAKSANCTGVLMNGLMLNYNTSMFPNFDIKETMTTLRSGIREASGTLLLFEDSLKYSVIRKDISYGRTKDNFTFASTMAEILSQQYDIPFEKTHHVIGGMIKKLIAQGMLEAKNMTGALMAEVSKETLGMEIVMTDEEMAKMMDPLCGLEGKATGGTPKPSDTAKMISQGRTMVTVEATWLAEAKEQVTKGYEKINKSGV